MPAPRILVADDQSDVLHALRLLLKQEGARAGMNRVLGAWGWRVSLDTTSASAVGRPIHRAMAG